MCVGVCCNREDGLYTCKCVGIQGCFSCGRKGGLSSHYCWQY